MKKKAVKQKHIKSQQENGKLFRKGHWAVGMGGKTCVAAIKQTLAMNFTRPAYI